MKNQMKRIFCVLILSLTISFIFIGRYLFGMDYASIVEQQMKVERNLEMHLEKVLSNIIGPDKITVSIKIEPNVERSKTETETWAEEKSKEAERAKAEEKEEEKPTKPFKVKEFLPGIPLKRNLVADEEESIKEGIQERKASGVKKSVESILKLPSSFIKRITAIIVIDKRVPETLIATVEDVATALLELDTSRGDRLVIKRVDFSPANPWWGFLLEPVTYLILLALIVIIALVIFLFGPVKKFLSSFMDNLKEISSAAQAGVGAFTGGAGGGMGIAEGEMRMEKKEGEGEGIGEEVEAMVFEPFKFIKGKDLKNLFYLIKDESPDRIAVIMGYLDAPMAAQLMQNLPPKLRMEVALAITRMKETPKEIMRKIEESIKKKIDYITGGIDRFTEILGMMDNKSRLKVLEDMGKESPELVEKIKKRLFTFDQIGRLDDQTLRIILGEVDSSALAVALRNVSQELKDKILGNMSEAGAALLKEEMEFGKPVTDQQIEEAQQKVVEIVLNLEKEGRFSIEGREEIKLLEEEELYNLSVEERLKRLSESMEKPDNEKAFEHYNNGIEEFQAGKYKEAIAEFEYSLRYNNKIWQTYQYLGTCYYSQGMEKEAVWAYKKALELNPDNEQLKEWLSQHELKEA